MRSIPPYPITLFNIHDPSILSCMFAEMGWVCYMYSIATHTPYIFQYMVGIEHGNPFIPSKLYIPTKESELDLCLYCLPKYIERVWVWEGGIAKERDSLWRPTTHDILSLYTTAGVNLYNGEPLTYNLFWTDFFFARHT